MKHNYTTQEDIIKVAKQIALRDGLNNLSMRKIANENYLALGTLYHYFENKEALMVSILEDFWHDKFKDYLSDVKHTSFIKAFEDIYLLAFNAYDEFKRLFVDKQIGSSNSLLLKAKAQEKIYIEHIKKYLIVVINKDEDVKLTRFNDSFPLKEFINTLINEILNNLLNEKNNCVYLKELIKIIVY